MPPLLLMRLHWRHMAPESGFDGLAQALERVAGASVRTLPSPRAAWPDRLGNRLRDRLDRLRWRLGSPHGPVSPFWRAEQRVLTRRAIAALQDAPETRLLLMAVEDQYDRAFSTLPAALRRRLVVVAHQSPAWYRTAWRDSAAFDGLGAILCLDAAQRADFAQRTTSPVIQIRHGVRGEFFTPPEDPATRATDRLLYVGAWQRDVALLARSMPIIWAARPEVRLDCVVLPGARRERAFAALRRDPRVTWHTSIDAEALRARYREATLLFLPLRDATANNAILEAMACGLPVITTAVGGTADYLPAEVGERCPAGDPAAHAAAVLRWLADPTRRGHAAAQGRRHVETHHRWDQIATGLLARLASVGAI